MIIQGGVIHIGDGTVVQEGYIRLEDGKIAEVSSGVYSGADREVLDAKGKIITPGFIDAHCHLGMFGDALGFESDDGNEETDPCTPHLRAIDAINPLDRAFGEALDYGITTVVTGPGSANPVAGQICAMKTWGRVVDEMVVKAPVGMKFALGENPKGVYNDKSQTPMTRMAIAAIIREELQKAKRYGEDCRKAQEDEDADPPELDVKCEALLPVLEGKVKAHFHTHRADDICTAIRIAKEFGVKLTLEHCTEGHLIVEELKRAGCPVAVGPTLTHASKYELVNKTFATPGILAQAGLQVSIITDHSVIPQHYLPLCAGLAVKAGMDPFAALQAITINPARHLGVADRVGSLEVGKDGDVVIANGDPMVSDSQVEAVVVNGRLVTGK